VLFDVFVDVDDGRGWARCGRITDCIRQSRGRVAGGMSISFVAVRRRGCRASAERVPSECRASHKQINRLPAAAEPIHLQKHKDLTLNRHLSSSPSQPDIHSRGNYKKRLTFVKLWIRVDQAEYL